MNGIDIIQATIAKRQVQGLSVEVQDEHSPYPFVRHFADFAARDAYIARCKARGQSVRIVT